MMVEVCLDEGRAMHSNLRGDQSGDLVGDTVSRQSIFVAPRFNGTENRRLTSVNLANLGSITVDWHKFTETATGRSNRRPDAVWMLHRCSIDQALEGKNQL